MPRRREKGKRKYGNTVSREPIGRLAGCSPEQGFMCWGVMLRDVTSLCWDIGYGSGGARIIESL